MDIVRSLPLFDPAKLRGARCTIIGVGAVGSAVLLQLAKLGVTDLSLYDHDLVEPHNIGNQLLFGPDDVNRAKVDAAAEKIQQLVGVDQVNIDPVQRRVLATNHISSGSQHVFMCVDTMTARMKISEALSLKPHILGLHDSRLSARTAAAYYHDPRDYAQCREYADTLYSDSDVLPETAGCGTAITMLPTVLMLAGTVVWNFIRAVNGEAVNLETAYATDALAVHAARPSRARTNPGGRSRLGFRGRMTSAV